MEEHNRSSKGWQGVRGVLLSEHSCTRGQSECWGKKEKEGSRNRGTAENEEEQGARWTVQERIKTRLEERTVPFAQSDIKSGRRRTQAAVPAQLAQAFREKCRGVVPHCELKASPHKRCVKCWNWWLAGSLPQCAACRSSWHLHCPAMGSPCPNPEGHEAPLSSQLPANILVNDTATKVKITRARALIKRKVVKELKSRILVTCLLIAAQDASAGTKQGSGKGRCPQAGARGRAQTGQRTTALGQFCASSAPSWRHCHQKLKADLSTEGSAEGLKSPRGLGTFNYKYLPGIFMSRVLLRFHP